VGGGGTLLQTITLGQPTQLNRGFLCGKTSIHTYNSAKAQLNSDNFTTTPTTLLEQQLNMLVGSS
jgi:hypothetical protein